MNRRSQHHSQRRRQRGQSLVEAALVLFVFMTLLLAVADCGQVVFAHQALVERARAAARWGSLHNAEGPEPVVNLILYGQIKEPPIAEGYLGMTPSNVRVTFQPATAEQPDDQSITVSVVNFESHLFSPWLARTLVSTRPVLITVPISAGAVASR